MMEIKVPELAESITEGTISRWVKRAGDPVREGDVVAELETDKVNVEISAEQSGVLKKILKEEGETVRVGEAIALLGEADGEAADPEAEKKAEEPISDPPPEPREAEGAEPGGDVRPSPAELPVATPAARKWARERGIDLRQVSARDPRGRVTAEDVRDHAAEAPSAGKAPGGPERDHPSGEGERPVERIRMSRRRLTIARRLLEAKQSTAMLTTFNEVDMSAVMEIRRRRKEWFRERHEVGLGFMSFFTKAVVGALKAFPLLNAEIRGEEILIKKYYDIGIAVSTDQGLVVPVVRNADRLSFPEIERRIAALAERARSGSLTLEELQGGTFTITNGGVFGSLYSTPILNPPQVGILGMHKIQKRPVVVEDDRVEVRPMMYLALSYDHRIIDGKEAVSFLVRVKELVEDPEQLLLEG
ncbi:2-oxoglutarate dehydrogenase E2 component [Planifilum fimeticola]|uniref:Dihydrolipoyllysine-residue succinyltransferase component of 2-oxoglutarate dehydrogenase complex n=1 Tax=Planifilum fimeticola TaxID=201975 RepID=A0A2T0LFF0_9BACL|nr:2-oxoglutarate dehydrogenase complex dihydrolipoyllysine-residue succinyltransferase [Planifilum fimeticola]PRX40952.1 2-oxoglutarate dehydrogenase E2 component [Planifilum fimeticola]